MNQEPEMVAEEQDLPEQIAIRLGKRERLIQSRRINKRAS
jgi:hypothetical protein